MSDMAEGRAPRAVKAAAAVRHWLGDKRMDLVCQGGGVLGIGLVGAYSVLEAEGFIPQNLAGTSAGAIVATLIAADYTAEEIRQIIFDLDFRKVMDPTLPLQLPIVGKTHLAQAISLLYERGLYRGDYFLDRMREYLEAKNVRTFGDLIYDPKPDAEPRFRHRVQVIASDVTARGLLRLPMDARKIGFEPDALPVAEAVRMSMSIPFFFKPVSFPPFAASSRRHTVVDGGMLSNFPVWLFDIPGIPPWPTIGIKLVASEQGDDVVRPAPSPIRGTVEYVRELIETMVQFHDRLYLDTESFARTIAVETGGMSATNFNLSDADKQALFASGQKGARDFLDHQWTFEGYIAAFRTGAPRPGRREIVAGEMQRAARALGLPPTPAV